MEVAYVKNYLNTFGVVTSEREIFATFMSHRLAITNHICLHSKSSSNQEAGIHQACSPLAVEKMFNCGHGPTLA